MFHFVPFFEKWNEVFPPVILNVVKKLFADMPSRYAQFTNRSFAIAQDDKIIKPDSINVLPEYIFIDLQHLNQ